MTLGRTYIELRQVALGNVRLDPAYNRDLTLVYVHGLQRREPGLSLSLITSVLTDPLAITLSVRTRWGFRSLTVLP